ncbi:MAG: acetyl-CoA carboxylase biotin carboxyl carrier protein subunit [bacterium]|nr:acetyl-CoA carboxylase biotin carboxyl carrier protein subunit [bacterium]
MSDEHQSSPVAGRVRRLAEFFVETDLLRLRIERDGEEIELGRKVLHREPVPELTPEMIAESAPVRLDAIKADLVGIFHLSRPATAEGDLLESDRELAYIEALGIRNPVRSRGPGRIASVACADGDAVEYGQVLFEIDRG